ncbi:hypothetical protein M8J75_003751 [Diaphorina citri]|nr:hypothetical protein M8J75_003751 [Diaphorina citri]
MPIRKLRFSSSQTRYTTQDLKMTEVMKHFKVNTPDWQTTSCTVAQRFQKLFELAEWADCKFLVGSDEPRTEFLCHKLVLAASSPVFEALFYGSLANKQDEPVVLPDMEPEHFQLFIKYLYTDTLIIPDLDTAQGILYAAQKYLIPHLAKHCVKYLECSLNLDNLLDTLRIAECFKESHLRKQCLKMMCTNPCVWWNPDLIGVATLSPSTFSYLLDIMPLPSRELDVLLLLIGWGRASCKALDIIPTGTNIRELLDQYDLLRRVRFLRMSSEEFALVKQREILTEQEALQIEKSILVLEEQPDVSSSICDSLCMPDGFSSLSIPRIERLTCEIPYSRCLMNNRIKYWLGGLLRCRLESKYCLLVTGFSMYTKLPNVYGRNYYEKMTGYEERFTITVKDHQYKTLSVTEYHNPCVQYNSTENIKLKEPFWVEPGRPYFILLDLNRENRGRYPSYELCDVVRIDQECIEFEEQYSPLDGRPEAFVTCGLIAALTCRKYQPDEKLLSDD